MSLGKKKNTLPLLGKKKYSVSWGKKKKDTLPLLGKKQNTLYLLRKTKYSTSPKKKLYLGIKKLS